jgi:putative transposase
VLQLWGYKAISFFFLLFFLYLNLFYDIISIMIKTYKYKLYKTKRLKNIHRLINISAEIYNHCIALHKRYYRLYGKTLNMYKLQSHTTKLKKRISYSHWNNLGSQAVQEITERIDKGYKKFFRHENKRPPTFKKKCKYKSFVLKGTVGYKIDGNVLTINKKHYKLWLSKEIDGRLKTLTVKRDTLGDIYVLISLEKYNFKDLTPALRMLYINEIIFLIQGGIMSGKSAGMDFGLKTFLTMFDGYCLGDRKSPLYFLKSLSKIRKSSKAVSKKKKGSHNRKQAVLSLARLHKKISNQRSDFFFKLANDLSGYDNIFIEDLNLKAMQMLWGRKISDVSFAKFVRILETKTNVVKIDRFYSSSKKCSDCGYVYHDLSLKERYWYCPKCGVWHNRDENAAKNIYAEGFRVLREGTSSLGVGNVRRTLSAVAVNTGIPRL